MNENLTSMVKNRQSIYQQRDKKDIEIPTEEVSEETQEEIQYNETVKIAQFSLWFEQNCKDFNNINQVKVAIRGIDPKQTLIVAVIDVSGGKDDEGNDKRKLRIFENADIHPVLNLPAISMDVYNNGFRIINEYTKDLYIKSYGVRTGLICVFCVNIEGQLLPYANKKIKKKDSEFEMIVDNPEKFKEKLSQKANLETLQLLYKQSSKVLHELNTNADVINWLIQRQEEITDINHHLQIDNVLIDMLKY